jgi:phage terminase small subunit
MEDIDQIPDDGEFTPRQQRFIEEYPIDLNGTKAAIRANYSENGADVQACRLLGNARIQEAIQKRRAVLAEKADLSVAKVLDTLKVIQGRCLQSEPVYNRDGSRAVVALPDGKEVACAFGFDSKGAIRSTELLGKHLGMFKEGMQLFDGQGNVMGEGGKLTIEIVFVAPAPRTDDTPPPPPVPAA